MQCLMPHYYVKAVDSITLSALKEANIKLVLLDRDNTIVPRDTKEAPASALAWIQELKEAGIDLMFVSNNWAKNVRIEADKLGLKWISKGLKPLPFVFWIALFRMKLKRSEAILVGDQIFTDVLGAKLAGIRSILVEPQSSSDLQHTLLLRKLEAWVLNGRSAQKELKSL